MWRPLRHGPGSQTALYYRSLSPQDSYEKYLQILYAQLVARARKQGLPDPIVTRQELFVPRRIEHPDGRPPKINRWRRRKAQERAARLAAEAAAKSKPSD
jgi:hypothetical protein